MLKCTCFRPKTNLFTGFCSLCNGEIVKSDLQHKEEQKKHIIEMMQKDEKLGLYDETLEQAANRILSNRVEALSFYMQKDTFYFYKSLIKDFAIDVAKWQAKEMYCKKSVNEMFDTLKRNSVNNSAIITDIDLFIDSWKKQFEFDKDEH